MINSKDFLLEIGCEELPSHTQLHLSQAFEQLFFQTLTDNKLSFSKIKTFATPRRIAVIVEELQTTQATQKIERQGPSYQDVFDKDGVPTLIGLGFARSCGVSMDKLVIKDTPKGKRVVCICEKPGVDTKIILPELVNKIITKLPLSKPMRWGKNPTQFARPVHWVVMLLGEECIAADILGVKSNSTTQGHRFHHPKPIHITQPKDYVSLLTTFGYVIPEFETRKNKIKKAILSSVNTDQTVLIDEELLNEVTGLVEWPVVLVGKFDPAFLSVPKEALITAMKTHQKCFPVIDHKNQLQPCFVLVSNINSKNPEVVIKGNERVVRARLSDAAFFFEQDQKQPLASRLEKLNHIVFQDQLGSMGDKTKRITKLAQYIAKIINADATIVKCAATLSKCDLVTGMVSEFPNLQGVMGYYYALHDKENKSVAAAIRDYYCPKFSGDELPYSIEACCLALADRLDTLIGVLGINKIPTGDKDPYALRRAASGICRLLIEKSIDINFHDLLQYAKKCYTEKLPNKNLISDTQDFIITRLKSFYLEKNIAVEVFESVLACNPSSLVDFDRRIKAVIQFQKLPEAGSLAAANKRVANILKKQEKLHIKPIDIALFEFDAEHQLSKQLFEKTKKVDALYEKADYEKALSELSSLKMPIDAFFDSVMIMVDDEKKKQNRLALLSSIHELLSKVADISLLPL